MKNKISALILSLLSVVLITIVFSLMIYYEWVRFTLLGVCIFYIIYSGYKIWLYVINNKSKNYDDN